MSLAFRSATVTERSPELKVGTLLQSKRTNRVFKVEGKGENGYWTSVAKELATEDAPQPAPWIGLNWELCYWILEEPKPDDVSKHLPKGYTVLTDIEPEPEEPK